ncbi:GerAB/ArcD/ProY family transporter [Alkalihalobacillus sp. AL-G]|uniref:GerAB/ArcD/ProY family transporter n=1 Tax=Alkalihalobacillus sp. AL-G TaxID=2926399 RepID=UPI00272B6F73|nr:GerAB/ArcD/ProY family transporter [Alkalihalobacillus sp. AL-G]WLD91696.1 spore germination protein [Alkalihalobacillus sp. AL-G]
MEKSKISPQQLFSLIVLFELGTALIVPLGVEAKQDAWLAELLGMTGGIVLLLQYYYLYRHYPNLLLTSYIQKIFGKYIGFFIALSYILFFIYGASRDLRESSELFLLPYSETPMSVLSGIMMILVCYALYQGIEVIARAGEIFFVLVFSMVVLTFFLTIGSNVVRFENLLPVLENGWKPVLTTAFPDRVFFPYGELICFTVIFPYLTKPEYGMKFGMVAMVLSGVILTMTIVIEIAVLGVNGLSIAVFPFLKLVEKLNIAGFVQGLEVIAMIVLIVGDFFKVAVFTYAAVISSTDLFKIKNHRKFVLPIGVMIFITSMVATDNFIEHIQQGKIVLKSIFPLFEFVIPLLLIIVLSIRRRIGGSNLH